MGPYGTVTIGILLDARQHRPPGHPMDFDCEWRNQSASALPPMPAPRIATCRRQKGQAYNGRKLLAKTCKNSWDSMDICYQLLPFWSILFCCFIETTQSEAKSYCTYVLCHSWNPHGGSWLVIVDAVPSTAGWNAALQRASHVRLHGPTTPWQHHALKNQSTGHQPTTLRTMTLATLATKDCHRFSLPQIWVQNPVKSCKYIEIEIIVHHSQSPVVMVSTLPQLAIKSIIPYLRHWPDQCDHWFVVKGQHRDRDQESQAESGKRRGTCRANERLLWKRWIVQQNRNRKY
jgi:hypothetical protein